jgi:hypothetical protein
LHFVASTSHGLTLVAGTQLGARALVLDGTYLALNTSAVARAVLPLRNGDVLLGCEDGMAFVFTRNVRTKVLWWRKLALALMEGA